MTDPAENRDVRGNTIKPHSVDAENVDTKNATVETEPTSDNEIARKVDIDAKADLNTNTGVLKSSQVPDLAITSVTTVQDKSARLSLTVEEGDVAIQTDVNTTYIFTGGDPSNDGDWSEIELDVIDAIQGSSISPDTVNANSVSTAAATIGGSTGIGFPSTSSDAGLSFDSWTTFDADRPVWLLIESIAQTDGSTRGFVQVAVDESGGTSVDYSVAAAEADPAAGSGFRVQETSVLPIPAGASVLVQNLDDPNSSNQIATDRIFEL